jgi:hypothetical protein
MRAAPDAGVAELARRVGSNTSTVSMPGPDATPRQPGADLERIRASTVSDVRARHGQGPSKLTRPEKSHHAALGAAFPALAEAPVA